MTPCSASSSEVSHQHALMHSAIGVKGSGAARYGAAMFFYNLGLVDAELLEIYRRCSKFDREDPIDLAIFEGITVPKLTVNRSIEITS